MNVKGLDLRLTRHACHIAATKGIDADEIKACYEDGEVTESTLREGQYVITGDGITLIGSPSDDRFMVITLRKVKTLVSAV